MTDVRIEWTQSPDDPTLSGDVVSYELAREPGPNPIAVVAIIPASADGQDTNHVEKLTGGTWFYRVRAVNVQGRRSAWSNEAKITVSGITRIHHVFLASVERESRVAHIEREPRTARPDHEPRMIYAGRL